MLNKPKKMPNDCFQEKYGTNCIYKSFSLGENTVKHADTLKKIALFAQGFKVKITAFYLAQSSNNIIFAPKNCSYT